MTSSSLCAAMTTEIATHVLIACAGAAGVGASRRPGRRVCQPVRALRDDRGARAAATRCTPDAVPPIEGQALGVPGDAGQYPQWGDKVPWRVRRQEQHAYTPPPISRHSCGDRYHARDRKSGRVLPQVRPGRGAPDAVSSVEVTATDGSSVTIAWPALRDNDVAGYSVYVNGARVGTQTPGPGEALARSGLALVHAAGSLPAARATRSVWMRSIAATATRRSPRRRSPPRPARMRRLPRHRAGCARWRRRRTRWCSPGRPRPTTSAWSSTGSTRRASASRPSATRAQRSPASPAARATWSRSTQPTPQATAPPRPAHSTRPPPARRPTSRPRHPPW